MNIFVLDKDPFVASQYHCDKHVVKMVLEYAQLLSNVHQYFGTDIAKEGLIYKQTHINHPCSIWARSSKGNYQWLGKLATALSSEYTKRYNRVHSSSSVIWMCVNNVPTELSGDITPFVQAMPDTYKNINPIVAYRDYYLGKKMIFAKWSKTKTPYWCYNAVQ